MVTASAVAKTVVATAAVAATTVYWVQSEMLVLSGSIV